MTELSAPDRDAAAAVALVVRTTEVRVGPPSSVDDSFAWDEGEGAHHMFFRCHLPTIGFDLDPDMPTVLERSEVLFAE